MLPVRPVRIRRSEMKNLSPPRWVSRLFPGITWHLPNEENKIFLTFDDGPVPGVTDFVLRELASRGAKATFFCVGRNADRYPDLLARIIEEGHGVGNHTYSHLSGFGVTRSSYYDDVLMANSLLHSSLFRPPYGRITPAQMSLVRANFRVVLWSVLSMDYSRRLSPEESLQIVMRNTQVGDIIVFHDSYKAERNLRYALPRALDNLLAAGFSFAPIVEPLIVADEANIGAIPPLIMPERVVIERIRR